MRLTIALVLLSIVAVAITANEPPAQCSMNMAGKKCAATEDFPKCNVVALTRTECTCAPGTQCKLEENDGSCDYSCVSVGDSEDDGGADMGPGAGMNE